MVQIIYCKDCKFQQKVWHNDRRLKERGYYCYSCEYISDPFESAPVWGKDNQFCSSAEKKDGE